MKVGNAMVVSLHYTLKGDDGEVLDSSEGKDPLVYLHGCGNLIEGFEDNLEDLTVDQEFEFTVPPEKGYGNIDQTQIRTMEKSNFPEDAELEVGMSFVANSPQGQREIRIIEIDGDQVKVDGNHHLAGKNLHFSGKIVEIREGTEEELNHGHAHGPGGHHH